MHMIAGTNFGSLVSTDGGVTWGWICREAMRASLDVNDPMVGIAGDGSLFVADGAGLWHGTPDGCDWSLADPTFSGPIPSLTTGAPHTLFAGTGFDEANNFLMRSTDDGATWHAVVGPTFRVFYESVAVAPSDPMRIYAVETLPPERVEPWQPSVMRSDDGGDTWSRVPYTLLPAEWHLFVIAVDPSDPGRLALRTQDLHMDGHDRVLVSSDGAATFTDAAQLRQVLAGAWDVDGSSIWIGGPLDGVWRSDDHGGSYAPAHSGLDVRGFLLRGGALWVTGTEAFDGFAIARSTDRGVTLPTFSRLSSITGIAHCPASSAVARICPMHQSVIDGVLGSEDAGPPMLDASILLPQDAGTDAMPPNESARCTCSVTSRGPRALSFLVAIAVARIGRGRRRRR